MRILTPKLWILSTKFNFITKLVVGARKLLPTLQIQLMRNLFQKVYTILTFVSAPGEYSTCMNMVIVTVRFRNKENAFSDTPVRNYLAYI